MSLGASKVTPDIARMKFKSPGSINNLTVFHSFHGLGAQTVPVDVQQAGKRFRYQDGFSKGFGESFKSGHFVGNRADHGKFEAAADTDIAVFQCAGMQRKSEIQRLEFIFKPARVDVPKAFA